jgi:hypothetical protein
MARCEYFKDCSIGNPDVRFGWERCAYPTAKEQGCELPLQIEEEMKLDVLIEILERMLSAKSGENIKLTDENGNSRENGRGKGKRTAQLDIVKGALEELDYGVKEMLNLDPTEDAGIHAVFSDHAPRIPEPGIASLKISYGGSEDKIRNTYISLDIDTDAEGRCIDIVDMLSSNGKGVGAFFQPMIDSLELNKVILT